MRPRADIWDGEPDNPWAYGNAVAVCIMEDDTPDDVNTGLVFADGTPIIKSFLPPPKVKFGFRHPDDAWENEDDYYE